MTKQTRIKRNILRAALAAALITGCGYTAYAATANMPAEASTASQSPSINGFRNANFGMSLPQVRNAIESEFKLPASAITQSQNQLQHTTVLSAEVPDLVPGGGTASVSYVFGYQSHKLIEVNILWSKEIDPKITPTTLYQNGTSLQQYFATEGFPPERSTGNIATPNGILLFRATDTTGNAILLIISGTITKDLKSPDKSALNPTSLTLAYAADPLHPDVFQLAKGSF